jgi:hypothetical protein
MERLHVRWRGISASRRDFLQFLAESGEIHLPSKTRPASVRDAPSVRHMCVDHGEQADTGGVDAQRARSKPDKRKSAGLKKIALERIPAAFRSDREQHASSRVGLRERGGDRTFASRVGQEPHGCPGELVEVVLDQLAELAMDGHTRQPRVARLLETLDQERPIARFGQDMGIEVRTLHPFRIREDDPPDAKRRKLRP